MEQRQRAVLLVYGEETEGLSIRVPKSKKQEVKGKFYEVLKVYENPTTVMVDCFNKVSELSAKSQNKQVVKKQLQSFDGYQYLDSFPLGSSTIEIIGHKVFKHYSQEIYYIKIPNGKEFKYVILESEKEVKNFIRKEILK